ncbi:CAT RNA binding domain-containing protein [Enterococcus songbeiensis]|uniref:CAT RNA binding domain-containing protein n=1 Tax=Enterococcus songbeiensis TaxID=2559927 RepID=UPI0010F89CA3|nr:CAT RNA binding domain-containing protein [Enterococcus songbeiensis]
MVVVQVLSHNAVIAKEIEWKGEWVLVQRGIGFGKKRGDVINATQAQQYRKIE